MVVSRFDSKWQDPDYYNPSGDEAQSWDPAPRKQHWLGRDLVSILNDLLAIWDFAAVLGAGYLATVHYRFLMPSGDLLGNFWGPLGREVLLGSFVAPLVLRDRQLSTPAAFRRLSVLIRALFGRSVMLLGLLLGVGFATRSLDDLSRGWVALWAAEALVFALSGRVALAHYVRALERQGRLREVVAIVGAGPVADRLRRDLHRIGSKTVEVIGIFDDRAARVPAESLLPSGSVQDLVEIGKQRHIDRVIVTLPWSAEKRLLAILRQLKHLAVEVAVCPEPVGLNLPRKEIEFLGDRPIMLIADRPLRRWSYVLKEVEDKVLASLMLLLLAPVMALVALAIRLESRGPVIFRQPRHGWNNQIFEVLKFRTMRWDPLASGDIVQTTRDDERITRLGTFLRRTSLDELPQLINVLKGEMSLVGPRPHAVTMRTEDQLGHEIVAEYAHRHRVKPGLTGWAQVNGYRGATQRAEQLRKRVEYDLYYIENWSILFDIKILAMTVLAVMLRENAF